MSVVARIESESAVLKLIRVGLRLSYARATTGIYRNRWLRDVWREVHQSPAPAGRTNDASDSGLRTIVQRRDAARWVGLYLGICETEAKSIQASRFFTSWRLFLELYPDSRLKVDTAWALVRNYFSREIGGTVCKSCGEFFVHGHYKAVCPFCEAIGLSLTPGTLPGMEKKKRKHK